MKFKFGDKVSATAEYKEEHARDYKRIWGIDWIDDGYYDNMIVGSTTDTLVFTNVSGIPWFEEQLEFAK